eukprot:896765_1
MIVEKGKKGRNLINILPSIKKGRGKIDIVVLVVVEAEVEIEVEIEEIEKQTIEIVEGDVIEAIAGKDLDGEDKVEIHKVMMKNHIQSQEEIKTEIEICTEI